MVFTVVVATATAAVAAVAADKYYDPMINMYLLGTAVGTFYSNRYVAVWHMFT